MKKIVVLLLLSQTLFAQYKTGEDLLRAMHKKYNNKYFPLAMEYDVTQISYHIEPSKFSTFKRNLATDTIFYEHYQIKQPDKIRCYTKAKDTLFKPSICIARNDSTFQYNGTELWNLTTKDSNILWQGKLIRKIKQIDKSYNAIELLNGKMYYQNIDTVIRILKSANFDLSKLQEQFYKGKICTYIIGQEKDSVPYNVVYVDAKTLKIKQICRVHQNQTLTNTFKEVFKGCNFVVEKSTKYITDYGKGKIGAEDIRKFLYSNFKTSISISDSVFYKK